MKRMPALVLLALASAMGACQQLPPSTGTSTQAQQTPPTQQQAVPNPAEFDRQMAQVEENIKRMQEQMDRLQRTQDPQERQRLLQQHWTTMQNTMAGMRGMWGPGMMGCCAGTPVTGSGMGGPMMGGMMGWQGAGGYYSNLTPEQVRQRQYMTDQYLAMQQQMMNHMMWHQRWANQLPSPAQK
ncbi:MAG TPA: hypothetical protein VL002_02365 [Candidimonas sp.]|nr:hypothetical protein [Candidimonas sp.]